MAASSETTPRSAFLEGFYMGTLFFFSVLRIPDAPQDPVVIYIMKTKNQKRTV